MDKFSWVGAGAVALLTVIATGCSSGSDTRAASTASAAAPSTTPVPSATLAPSTTPIPSTTLAPRATSVPSATVAPTTAPPPTVGAPLADDDLARAVALRDDDPPGGVTFSLIEMGDVVTGQVTLDVCSARFPSEAMRVARYQQVGRDGAGTFAVNNENVVYGTVAGAAQAMTEIRAVVAECPDTFVPPVLQGQPPLKFAYEPLPEADLGPVAADHVALSMRAEDRSGKVSTAVFIYQRRGRVLVGVYGRDLASIKPYVGAAALHLASLAAVDAAADTA